jgi:hypothetical protein
MGFVVDKTKWQWDRFFFKYFSFPISVFYKFFFVYHWHIVVIEIDGIVQ